MATIASRNSVVQRLLVRPRAGLRLSSFANTCLMRTKNLLSSSTYRGTVSAWGLGGSSSLEEHRWWQTRSFTFLADGSVPLLISSGNQVGVRQGLPSSRARVHVSTRLCIMASGLSLKAEEGSVPVVDVGQQPSVSSLPPAESLFLEKKAVRSVVKKELRQLSKEQRQEEDDAIQQHVLDLSLFQKAGRVCAYLACEPLREVDTKRIIPAALSQGKVLYVPRVEDRAAHMRMLRIKDPQADTERNSMGIAEPTPLLPDGQPREDVMEANEALDLILMPGLAFDRSGKRLGRGGGYYDVFLQRYLELVEAKGWKRPLLIAMAYKAQIRDSIPADKTDQLVDGLITSDGLLSFSNSHDT